MNFTESLKELCTVMYSDANRRTEEQVYVFFGDFLHAGQVPILMLIYNHVTEGITELSESLLKDQHTPKEYTLLEQSHSYCSNRMFMVCTMVARLVLVFNCLIFLRLNSVAVY